MSDPSTAARIEDVGVELAGWGNYPRLRTVVATPRDDDALHALVTSHSSFVARGNGRSYGDSTLNPDRVVSTLGRSRMLAFDGIAGRVTCESGLLLADLLRMIVPNGWFVPVTPGTQYVTLGGMLAAAVHGKNGPRPGFGAHVEALTLLTPDGTRHRCTSRKNAELFRATIGGMGLTGVVLDLTFTLIPIETAWIRQETIATADLEETLALFEADAPTWPYTVAWFDCLSRAPARGRAIFQRARHAFAAEIAPRHGAPLHPPRRAHRRIPMFFPDAVLNGWTVRAFNEAYYRAGRLKAGTALLDYAAFFYPLDTLEEWNRIYGRRGFTQYQCVLPRAAARAGLDALLERIAASGQGSFLAVLKRLGEDRSGYLSFPLDGYTLALDFPLTRTTLSLLDALDRIVVHHGGRLYLAKDARTSPGAFAAGYDTLDDFREIRARVDPARRISSRQAVRLQL